MGRPRKSDDQKARNAGYVAYPKEIETIREVSVAKRFKMPFDYLRSLVIADSPKTRRSIAAPRRSRD